MQRPPNRFRAYALLCRAGPRAAAAWFRRTCLASDPRAPAGRPAADAPIRDPKFLRKYACACVDVRHRRRFPGRREQDDERAPYYALFWTPPPATGFTWAVNGEFPTLRSQQTQISRKCAHFDARRYVRGSVPEFNARVYGAHTIGHRTTVRNRGVSVCAYYLHHSLHYTLLARDTGHHLHIVLRRVRRSDRRTSHRKGFHVADRGRARAPPPRQSHPLSTG